MIILWRRVIPFLLAFAVILSAVSLMAPPVAAASAPSHGHTSGFTLPARATPQQGPVLTGGGSGNFPQVCHWVTKPGHYVASVQAAVVDAACSYLVRNLLWGFWLCRLPGGGIRNDLRAR